MEPTSALARNDISADAILHSVCVPLTIYEISLDIPKLHYNYVVEYFIKTFMYVYLMNFHKTSYTQVEYTYIIQTESAIQQATETCEKALKPKVLKSYNEGRAWLFKQY